MAASQDASLMHLRGDVADWLGRSASMSLNRLSKDIQASLESGYEDVLDVQLDLAEGLLSTYDAAE